MLETFFNTYLKKMITYSINTEYLYYYYSILLNSNNMVKMLQFCFELLSVSTLSWTRLNKKTFDK